MELDRSTLANWVGVSQWLITRTLGRIVATSRDERREAACR